MLFILSPDLMDGLTLIGLVSLMAILICPLFLWALTIDLGQSPKETPATLREKVI